MRTNTPRLHVAFLFAGLAALSVALGGCGGAVDPMDDDDVEISETDAALTGPNPGPGVNDDERKDGDDGHDCRDGDHHNHKHHIRHKLKVLDRLDGAEDRAVTIAALPPGLPDRLIAKLHELDANADGIVTIDEVKAATHGHKKHGDKGEHGKHDKHDKHEKKDKHGDPR